jgi:CMP-N-acetylneuraminic acid synthetase
MTNNKSFLCIIPARAGSKRVKNKNLTQIAGASLVKHAHDAATESRVFDFIAVSSDREEMADGFTWIKRPAALSGPKADISAAVRHGLVHAEKICDQRFDYVVTLQPAIPIRNGFIIRHLCDKMISLDCRAGLTGVPVVPWLWEQHGGDALNGWSPGPYPRSQQFEDRSFWQEINTVQVADRQCVLEGKRWCLPMAICLLPSYAVLDIDTPDDLKRCEIAFPKIQKALALDKKLEVIRINTINGYERI